MSRGIKIIFLSWLLIFMQSTVMGFLSLWQTVPDLITVLICLVGLKEGSRSAVRVGVLSGFWADCYHPATMGLYTMTGAVAGFLIGSLRARVYREQLFSQVALTALLVFFKQALEFVIRSGGGLGSLPAFVWRYGIGCSLYTAAVAVVLIPFINRIVFKETPVKG